MSDHDTLISEKQLAQKLGVTTRTTLRMRRAGTGPKFVRVGDRGIRYRDPDVDEWLASRTFPTLAAEAAARIAA